MQQPMARPTLILATVIYLLMLLPAIMLAPFSVFLFDSGDADILTYIFASLWFVFPASLLLAVLGSWYAHVRAHKRMMGVFLLLPVAHAVLIVLAGILQFAR